ncbi:MAG: RNA polymerase sigma factor [Candidatus Methylomirabilales bacterium]
MAAVQADQPGAFEALYARYRVRLYNFIRRFIGDQPSTEDIFQETFLRVYRERHRYKPRVAVSTWLYTIARNLCLHEIEKRSRRQPASPHASDLPTTLASPTDDPLSRLEGSETAGTVARAVGLLPPAEREVLILARYEGLPHTQIAAITGKSEGAVRVALSRALAALRDHLQRDQ